MPCWYFEKEDLENTPSRGDGVNNKTEARYRKEAARLILEAGQTLSIHYNTCASAIVYLHRFYVFRSFKHFHRFVTATSCLFLACKFSKEKSSLNDVMKTIDGILSDEQMKIFGPNPKVEIVATEQAVLETLKFDLCIENPFSYLIHYVKQLKGESEMIEQLMQMAWTFVNDGLCLTLCVEWEPDLLAITYIYLASRLMKFEVTDWVDRPADFKGKWYNGLVTDVNVEIIKDICQQILKLYSDVSAQDEITISAGEEEELQPSYSSRKSISPLIVEMQENKKVHETTVLSNAAKDTQHSLSREQHLHKSDTRSRSKEQHLHKSDTRSRSKEQHLHKSDTRSRSKERHLHKSDTRSRSKEQTRYSTVETDNLSPKSAFQTREKEWTRNNNRQERSSISSTRKQPCNREHRSPSRSRRTRSRSGPRDWSRLRSISPSFKREWRRSSRARSRSGTRNCSPDRRSISPSYNRVSRRFSNARSRSGTRNWSPDRRRYVSPTFRSSAVAYRYSRSPLQKRKSVDILDYEGMPIKRAVNPEKFYNRNPFPVKGPLRDPGGIHLSQQTFESLQRNIEEPCKVPLSLEEFNLLQKQVREARDKELFHRDKELFHMDKESSPSFDAANPKLGQLFHSHIPAVFDPLPQAILGRDDYRPRDVIHSPPGAVVPYYRHPIIGVIPPAFKMLYPPHLFPEVRYPLQSYFPPPVHVPPPTMASNSHLLSQFPPSTTIGVEVYTPTPGPYYLPPPSGWGHDFPVPDSHFNQSSSMHSVQNMNVIVDPFFNAIASPLTSNRGFSTETYVSNQKSNLIHVQLSNVEPPQKAAEKMTRLHFIGGGTTSLNNSKPSADDDKVKHQSIEFQSRVPPTTGATKLNTVKTSQPAPSSTSRAISNDVDAMSTSFDGNKIGTVRKILILGHTFVRQLYDSRRCFPIDADVVIDGLYGATVDQLKERVKSLQKTPFDVVYIDVGSFDFLDPSQMPGDVAQRILDIGTYLTIEWDVKCIVISEIIPLQQINHISYRSNIRLGNIALKNLVDKSERMSFWHHAKLGVDMNACFAPSGRELNERGVDELFSSVKLALQSALGVSITRNATTSQKMQT